MMDFNGNLLLNIGPMSDGTIPEKDASILREIGKWLKINGEAIYGTHLWRKYGEGPTQVIEGQFSDRIKKNFTSEDIRYTMKGNDLYATVMRCSRNGQYRFQALGRKDASHEPNFAGIIENVSLLGFDSPCIWTRDESGLYVNVENVQSEYPIVFRIELA